MRSTVFPEPLRTAKDKLHSPRPRIAGSPINVLCHSMLLNFGFCKRFFAALIVRTTAQQADSRVQRITCPAEVCRRLATVLPGCKKWKAFTRRGGSLRNEKKSGISIFAVGISSSCVLELRDRRTDRGATETSQGPR